MAPPPPGLPSGPWWSLPASASPTPPTPASGSVLCSCWESLVQRCPGCSRARPASPGTSGHICKGLRDHCGKDGGDQPCKGAAFEGPAGRACGVFLAPGRVDLGQRICGLQGDLGWGPWACGQQEGCWYQCCSTREPDAEAGGGGTMRTARGAGVRRAAWGRWAEGWESAWHPGQGSRLGLGSRPQLLRNVGRALADGWLVRGRWVGDGPSSGSRGSWRRGTPRPVCGGLQASSLLSGPAAGAARAHLGSGEPALEVGWWLA